MTRKESVSDRDDILRALAAQNEQRLEMASDIKAIAGGLTQFKTEYLQDMRGEGKINGYKGLIAEVQFVKDEIVKHPSIARWIAMNPARAIASAFGAFGSGIALWFILHALACIPGVAAWFTKTFGG